MATATTQHLLLSPAELAYLHSSLSLIPPVRPDGRTASQFRPLTAETDVLPGTNGSARVCFADGTEAVVGIKAEVEKRRSVRIDYDYYYENKELRRRQKKQQQKGKATATEEEVKDDDEEEQEEVVVAGENDWVEISVEIPGYRDDDSSTVFLGTMLGEALLADGEFTKKLWINRRFHWKLYIDVSLLYYIYIVLMCLELIRTSPRTDHPHLPTPLISPPAPQLNYAPCTTRHALTPAEIRGRRRPYV